jgi:Na+/proline symporter
MTDQAVSSPTDPRRARRRGILLTLLALFVMMALAALLGAASALRYPGPVTPTPAAEVVPLAEAL